jgi:hypothetical protein
MHSTSCILFWRCGLVYIKLQKHRKKALTFYHAFKFGLCRFYCIYYLINVRDLCVFTVDIYEVIIFCAMNSSTYIHISL